MRLWLVVVSWVVLLLSQGNAREVYDWNGEKLEHYKKRVKHMFYHSYDNYLNHAYPYDELKPITGEGHNTYGGLSLTLIDSLDTLAILGNTTEFARVVHLLSTQLDFNININVSLFETNIRVLAGLISAHLMYKQVGVKLPPNWPCNGPLLTKAVELADKLTEAFDTVTGMPHGSLNLKYGVSPTETPVTCTACVGTYYLEFTTLSRLTGNSSYEAIALRALRGLWKSRSNLDLVGNHVNVTSGKWVFTDSTIGSGVDSYFEYLLKGAILTGSDELLNHFKTYKKAINKHMNHEDWYLWVAVETGQVTFPFFNSLEAFWPGLLTLQGDIESAKRAFANYYSIWKYYGFVPEFVNIQKKQVMKDREGYPLRPELIESAYYLFQATRDPFYLDVARQVVHSLEHSCEVDFGFAHVNRVTDHALENQMESFFLAETVKYLYLLFDLDNFINSEGDMAHEVHLQDGTQCLINTGGYIFNTEAHPVDPSALYCCHNARLDQLQIKSRTLQFEKKLFLSGNRVPVEKPHHTPDSKLRQKTREKLRPEYARSKDFPFHCVPVSNSTIVQCPVDLEAYLIETALGFDELSNYGLTTSKLSCFQRPAFAEFFNSGQVTRH